MNYLYVYEYEGIRTHIESFGKEVTFRIIL